MLGQAAYHNESALARSLIDMMGLYILDENNNPVQASIDQWVDQLTRKGSSVRRVDRTTIGEVFVSTVFLGVDHSHGSGPPVLWETMVFGGPMDQEQDRCSGTIKDARKMHKAMVAKVKQQQKGQ